MATNPLFWLALFGGAVVHWLLPRRLRAPFVALLSFGVVGSLDIASAGMLAGFVLLFHFLAPKAAEGPRGARISAALILLVLGFLLFFKYVPPLVEAIAPDATGLSLVLPLGISYFTFKLVHYAVEVRRGNIEDRSFWTFASYLFLFPIFTAGPIERFDHFLAEREDAPSRAMVVEGGTRIVHGLVKKFVLAEMVVLSGLMGGNGIDHVMANLHRMGTGETWAFLASALLYAYFDFAGYSDLAIGASRLFGHKIQENFNWPLLAPDIGNFWKRWHMTLAGWCQAYVYMPFLGLTRNPYVGVYMTFIVMGLWHAGNLNYLSWGLYHATGVAVALTWARAKRKRRWTVPSSGVRGLWRNALTMAFVCGSMVFSTTHRIGIGAAARLGARALGIELEFEG